MGKYKVCKIPNVEDPEMAWAFGFTAADGSLVKPSRQRDPNVISYTLNAKDADVLLKIKYIFQLEHPIGEHLNNQGRKIVYLRFTDSKYEHLMFDQLDLNIKRQFPDVFISNNTRHYMRGLFDGDGCLHHRKRGGLMMIFINENESIVKDFAYCVSKYLGLDFQVPKKIDKDNIWRIQYESRSARLLAWWLYHGDIDHMSLQRKRESYQSIVNPMSNNLDQFFEAFFGKELRNIPERHGKGIVIPMSFGPNTDSLKVCKSIQCVCAEYNIKCTPVFKNKGQRKYYMPYFPAECVSSIKTLRPFEYLLKG